MAVDLYTKTLGCVARWRWQEQVAATHSGEGEAAEPTGTHGGSNMSSSLKAAAQRCIYERVGEKHLFCSWQSSKILAVQANS
jgi:hypothetical protein